MKEPMEKGGPVADQPLPYSAEELPEVLAWLSEHEGLHRNLRTFAGTGDPSPWAQDIADRYARLAATLAELAQLRQTIENMRMPEATADDAPPEWGNTEAAAWADGFASAMQEVHQAAIDGPAARALPETTDG